MSNHARVMQVDLRLLGASQNPAPWLSEAVQANRQWTRRGTPLHIPLTADGHMDPVVVSWAHHFHNEHTAMNYASDVAAYFGYLGDQRDGLSWLDVRRGDVTAYFQWRRTDATVIRRGAIQRGVSASTIVRNRAALMSLYGYAADHDAVSSNPVPTGNINVTRGQVLADVNWLTRRAYQRWRSEALLGVGAARAESMVMRDRNAAYADLLYSSGMRRSEAAGLLLVEVPTAQITSRLFKGRVPGALSKNSPERGRIFYLGREVLATINEYVSQMRVLDEAAGLASGVYEEVPNALIVQRVSRRNGLATKVTVDDTESGETVQFNLDELDWSHRARTFGLDSEGRRRPLALWLGQHGRPLQPTSWNDVFSEASDRMAASSRVSHGSLQIDDDDSIYVHPHMLRHSFALHVFALSAMMSLRQQDRVSQAGLRSLIEEGNIWLRVQNLLGHKNLQVTRDHYLAPVLALEWDWFLAATEQAPTQLDEALALIAQSDERVIDSPIGVGS
ncbi:tyrosine-type recombinase/integrase [Rhodococcus sp. BGS-1C]|uniref:tyrosine-type recombinase/integrase n=3 Tax=Rhodococcus TaxID=1827 RepID=UPI0019D09CA3|nr:MULTISPECIES: site-specific integrase [unclassified Rhodococcus (in: high G+C Gram-positive bacteria)]MCC8930768.1 tyrosine-type recombinase/integrase [Rhodococcus sp. I2R]MDI9926620.1 tyrosine-type recombinase/integrase [Rhodococcus sp. IEGM 1341]